MSNAIGAQTHASQTSAPLPASTADAGVGKQTLTSAIGPSLRAESTPAVAESFGQSGAALAGQVGAEPAQGKSAADVAEGGFAGSGGEIPHRKQMEKSFGMDFGHVKAHSGGGAARANDKLGSQAYAMGNQVAFKNGSPSPALVAHELTHVVQHGEGPAMKSDGAVDTSGEAEADAVESAVSAGKPASGALRSGGGGTGKAVGAGPARKRGPALDGGEGSKFGMGMTFSLEGFEKSYDYTIWKGHYAWPIGVPGVNFVVDPNVKVSGKGAAKFGGESKGDLSAQLGVFGECGIGLSGGIPDVAEVYGTFNPGIEGAFTLTKHGEHKEEEHKEGEPKSEAKGPASTWSLAGSIGLKAAVKIGVSLAGGIVDQAFELGSIEIAKLTGVYFDQTGFRSDRIGFEWSAKIKQVFDTIKQLIDKAQRMGKAAIVAAKNAANAAGNAANAVGNAASATGNAIAGAATNFSKWVTSW